jgi:preprotein translocase subunit SecG
MTLVLLVIQIILAIFLVLVILLQKTSGDGLSSMASNPARMGMTGQRSATDFLTKTTAVLAVLFMVNSLVLARVVSKQEKNLSIIEKSLEEKKSQEKVEVPIAQ